MRGVALGAALALGSADAYKIFQQKLPNGAGVPGVHALGHERDGGGPNNAFGLDFIAARFEWTPEFCRKDSDGDGQTNGQELGDPCCQFVHRQNPAVRWTQGVSHPGDAESTSDPKLWADVVCGDDAPTETAQAAELKEEKEEEKKEDKEKEETALLAAEQPQEQLGAALQSSAMLSAVALTAVVVYLVVVRTGRRSARNLPIFRQRRGGGSV
ncbi:unnamed protein product [Phytophthora fragariaefolia]|uniref:Unnamed protein product n=1 Tax=Phytophthora fragariaefolia TaxID=1490495 RepID=A0A9W6YC69_9STRA|nr:unnamed protein product [Phytophthora fragariaefolia]